MNLRVGSSGQLWNLVPLIKQNEREKKRWTTNRHTRKNKGHTHTQRKCAADEVLQPVALWNFLHQPCIDTESPQTERKFIIIKSIYLPALIFSHLISLKNIKNVVWLFLHFLVAEKIILTLTLKWGGGECACWLMAYRIWFFFFFFGYLPTLSQ